MGTMLSLLSNEAGRGQPAWEELYRALCEHSSDAIFVINREGRFIDANAQFCDLLGFTRLQLLQLSLGDVLYDDPHILDTFKQRTAPGETFNLLTCSWRSADGNIFLNAACFCFLSDGSLLGILKITPEENPRSLIYTHIGIENSPIAISCHDEKGRFLDVNEETCRSLGYSRDELSRMTISDIDPMFSFGDWKEKWPASSSQSSYVFPSLHRRKDGTTFPVEVMVRFFRFQKQLHSVAFSTDITERVRKEQALTTLNQQNEKAMELARMARWEYDVTNEVYILNDQFYALHGRTVRDASDYCLTVDEFVDRFVPQDKAAEVHQVNRLIQQTADPDLQLHSDTYDLRADGSLMDVHIWSRVEKDEHGKTVRLYGVLQDISAQKQREKELRQALDRARELEEIIQRSPGIVFVWEPVESWPVVYVSDSIRQFGYHPEDFTKGKVKYSDFIHFDDLSRVIREVERFSQEKRENYSQEYRIVTRDGNVCWVDDRTWVRRGENGDVQYYEGILLDITQKKQAEIALSESEFFLKKSQDVSHLGSYKMDVVSGAWTCTAMLDEIFGIGEGYPKNVDGWVQLIHPDDQVEMAEYLEQYVLKGKNRFEKEYRIIRQNDHQERWVFGAGELEYDGNGNIIRMIGTIHDITERKRTELLLRTFNSAALTMQKAQMPREILKAVSDELTRISLDSVIFLLDETRSKLIPMNLNFRVQFLDMLEKISGMRAENFPIPIEMVDNFQRVVYERQTVFLEDIKDAISQAFPKYMTFIVARILQAIGDYKAINTPLIVDNDVIGLFSVQAKDLRPSDAPVVTAFAHQVAAAWRQSLLFEQAQQELAARKQAEAQIRQLNEELETRVVERTAQLEAANKELEAFSYSVSHDLRAPLRAIDGYTSILLEDYEPSLDEQGKRICGAIQNGVQRMSQLIDDLLAFSRLSRTEMRTSVIDMQTLANSAFQELIASEDLKRIDFRLGKLPAARCDPKLIHQVWVNLLSNAIKFSSTREKAMIEVGGMQAENEIVYYVRDNGVGFDLDYADKLFVVFQRLHSDKEFSGTGVGLAIVQRILMRHGGRIWADGKVGAGATFYFSLPGIGKSD